MDPRGVPVTAVPLVQQPVLVIPPIQFGPEPLKVTCGNCQRTVMTTTVMQNGACAWIAAVIVCLLCCVCFWIPLAMESCKDVEHTCPSCGAVLGKYRKI